MLLKATQDLSATEWEWYDYHSIVRMMVWFGSSILLLVLFLPWRNRIDEEFFEAVPDACQMTPTIIDYDGTAVLRCINNIAKPTQHCIPPPQRTGTESHCCPRCGWPFANTGTIFKKVFDGHWRSVGRNVACMFLFMFFLLVPTCEGVTAHKFMPWWLFLNEDFLV